MQRKKPMVGSKGTVMTAKQERRFLRNQKRKRVQGQGVPPPIPAKTWAVQKPAQRKQRKQRKLDTRVSVVGQGDLAVATALPSITTTVQLYPETLYGVCVQYVSVALSRGFLAYTGVPSNAYLASVYMVNILIAYAQGSVPQALELPYWLQCFGQALMPKKVPFKNGSIFFRFEVEAAIPFIPPPGGVVLGSTVYSYEWQADVQGAGVVDGFPVGADPNSYTEAAGAAAWMSLAEFMAVDGRSWTELKSLAPTTWEKNVSAFAMPLGPEGCGFNESGGQGFQASLEVPIHTPILSVFANFLVNGGATSDERWAKFTTSFAGDPLLAGAMFSHLAPPSFLGTKQAPQIHPMDFIELLSIVANYLRSLLAQAGQSAEFMATVTDPSQMTCPLSLQEVGLLLRNELMVSWNLSQCALQSLLPRLPQILSSNEFQPYTCSSTTVGLKSQEMKLPYLICENVAALQARWVTFAGAKKNGEQWFAPVLGQYVQDALTQSDYVVTVDIQGVPTTVPVFATVALRRRVRSNSTSTKTTKDVDLYVPEVEPTISYIDGTSGVNNVFINDPTRLSSLATLWNEWLPKYQTYSVKLATISREQGVNICTSVGMTRHWINISQNRKALNAEFIDERLTRRRHLMAEPYASRQQIAITCHDKPISAPFEKIQAMWWLPINFSNSGQNPSAQSEFNRQRTMMDEPQSVASASEGAGTSLAEIHSIYANQMVHAAFAAASEIDEFFTNQANAGHGGILSGLVSGFLGKAFGPTVGSIAGAISEILPI